MRRIPLVVATAIASGAVAVGAVTPGRAQTEPPPQNEAPRPQNPTPPNGSSTEAPPDDRVQVLVGEVRVTVPAGATALPAAIEKEVFDAIETKPGRPTSRAQLQTDINTVFALGYFSNVRADLEDTDLGVRVTLEVTPNPILRSFQTEGATVLKPEDVQRIFGQQVGQIANLRQLQTGIREVERFYQDKGFVLAQVVDINLQPDGTANLIVAEGTIEDIKVAFVNEEGKTEGPDGQPIRGRTREFIITRELSLKPGDVFNRNTVQEDLRKVFGLGLFEDVNLALNPGTDPRKVVVTVNVKERSTGSFALGGGISSATGLFGSVSLQQQNLGGNNQKLGLDIQVGERELLFDLNFTDPWLAGDPLRTSFSTNLFNRRLFSFVYDNPDNNPTLGVGPNNDVPRENRLGLGINFARPLSPTTTASLGLRFERVTITDADNRTTPFDNQGNQLAFTREGQDDLLLLQFALAQDFRNDRLRPTAGSVSRLAVEQALPVGNGSLFFNRLRASYSFFLPVNFVQFAEGPQTLAFNVQAGTILGEFPPYEAFRLGGSNSIRGWDEGRIGSGKSFALISAEYRFPLFAILNGVLFADYGSDLGSGKDVLGNPGAVRGKPGSGGGYGAGLRIQSPLGSIRVDYGVRLDGGGTQFSFGLGEKF
ncbi:MAG: BamA/TamA family outer membrane protein [Pseudanabaenaceae cyanobacterium]